MKLSQESLEIFFLTLKFKLEFLKSPKFLYPSPFVSLTKKVFICDFPSEFVDFKQPNSQHFKVKETIDFIVKNLSRRFQLRHDILPYEMTVIVYKDDCIKRPESAFSVDL